MGRRRLLMFTMKMPVSDEILLGEKRLTSFQCLGQIAGHYFSCLTYPCVLERNDNCAFGSGSLYNEICMSFWCSFQNFEGNSPCLGSPVSAPGLPRAGSSSLLTPILSVPTSLYWLIFRGFLTFTPLKLNMHQIELSIPASCSSSCH